MPAVTTKLVRDSHSLTLSQAALAGRQVGEYVYTSKHRILDSNGLQWWIVCFPTGWGSDTQNNVCVTVRANKNVTGMFTIDIRGSFMPSNIFRKANIINETSRGFPMFPTFDVLRASPGNGQLSITCSIEFEVPVLNSQPLRLSQFCDHVPKDFALVVGSNRVHIQKGLLSLLSPVFHAMLTHDTEEARKGEVGIKDFDYDTVKTAIDFCYGKKIGEIPAEMILNVLRFADKYDMKAITTELEEVPKSLISLETVCAIIRYANDLFKGDLLEECRRFIRANFTIIKHLKSFTTMSRGFAVHLLKITFDLKTELDVLRFAHKNSIDFIVNYLEEPYQEELSLENFCSVVSFAWGCSREELKQSCAKFYSENFEDILKMEEFTALPGDAMRGVVELGRTYMCSQKGKAELPPEERQRRRHRLALRTQNRNRKRHRLCRIAPHKKPVFKKVRKAAPTK